MLGQCVKVALRIVAYTVLFLGLFGLSFLAFAWLLGWVRGEETFAHDPVILGLICNLIAWLFVVVFHLGNETVLLAVQQRRAFMMRASRLLRDMGYEITAESDDSISSRPGFKSLLLGWGVQVRCLGSHARVSGPKVWVEIFRRRLRCQHHLDHAQSRGFEPRRGDDQFLPRVQLQFRVAPEQLEEMRREVIDPLVSQGDVICEMSLLAYSDAGIRESLIDGPIRAWMQKNDIAAEVHKDLARLPESASGEYHPIPQECAS